MLAESSTRRGAGLAVKARCPLHLNITAALLDTLSDMQTQMAQLLEEVDADNFKLRVDVIRAARTAPGTDGTPGQSGVGAGQASGKAASSGNKGKTGAATGGRAEGDTTIRPPRREDHQISRYRHREVVQYNELFCAAWLVDGASSLEPPAQSQVELGSRETSGGGGDGRRAGPPSIRPFPVCHEFTAPLPLESRMSFTILNLTGQRARYFQPRAGEETRRLQYLRVSIVGTS